MGILLQVDPAGISKIDPKDISEQLPRFDLSDLFGIWQAAKEYKGKPSHFVEVTYVPNKAAKERISHGDYTTTQALWVGTKLKDWAIWSASGWSMVSMSDARLDAN
ncbi:MAG: hypothetical protein ACOX33_11060 [Dethiobacteria bacterium]